MSMMGQPLTRRSPGVTTSLHRPVTAAIPVRMAQALRSLQTDCLCGSSIERDLSLPLCVIGSAHQPAAALFHHTKQAVPSAIPIPAREFEEIDLDCCASLSDPPGASLRCGLGCESAARGRLPQELVVRAVWLWAFAIPASQRAREQGSERADPLLALRADRGEAKTQRPRAKPLERHELEAEGTFSRK